MQLKTAILSLFIAITGNTLVSVPCSELILQLEHLLQENERLQEHCQNTIVDFANIEALDKSWVGRLYLSLIGQSQLHQCEQNMHKCNQDIQEWNKNFGATIKLIKSDEQCYNSDKINNILKSAYK